MSKDLESHFTQLEKNILVLKKKYQNLKEDHEMLTKNLVEMKQKYDVEKRRNQELVEEQKNIKLQSAISGNPEHNRLMKNHINRLVKEVDACIAQLQNNGL